MSLPGEFAVGSLRLLARAPDRLPMRTDLWAADGFTLHPVLSPEECAHYIADSERLGYVSLEALYDRAHRTNDRRIVMSPELAAILWQRIGGFFRPFRAGPRDEQNGIPQSTYDPVGLNECFKFLRYEPGGFFKSHTDTPFVRGDGRERSLLTVTVYLNGDGDFGGGETEFLGRGGGVREAVRPRAGAAACFYHFAVHQGAPVSGGRKYILRTDVMFRRRA